MSRHLGIDYGTKRCGLAISDGIGLTAQPLEVVSRDDVVDRVVAVVDEYGVGGIIIGMPTGMGGQEGNSAEGARELGAEIAEVTQIEVEYVDERFTSRLAEDSLLESGMKRRDRRETVDKVAASIILQTYLDRHHREL